MYQIDKEYEEKRNDQFFEEDIVKSIEETFSIHHRSKEELIKILEGLVEEYKEDVMYDKYDYDEYVLFSKNKQLSIYIEDIDTVPMTFTKKLNEAMLVSHKYACNIYKGNALWI